MSNTAPPFPLSSQSLSWAIPFCFCPVAALLGHCKERSEEYVVWVWTFFLRLTIFSLWLKAFAIVGCWCWRFQFMIWTGTFRWEWRQIRGESLFLVWWGRVYFFSLFYVWLTGRLLWCFFGWIVCTDRDCFRPFNRAFSRCCWPWWRLFGCSIRTFFWVPRESCVQTVDVNENLMEGTGDSERVNLYKIEL